jgi:DNA-binding NarL/FixJ family response regulator
VTDRDDPLQHAHELGVERIASPLELVPLAAALERAERRALGYIARALRREFESRTADAQLTPQQEAISWMSVLGATAKEVAATRGVAVRTVETHRYEVLKKLNLATTESLRWQLLARVLPPWRAK